MMGFEKALVELKKGNPIKRNAWKNGDSLELDGHIMLHPSGQPWRSSHHDILAEDWQRA